MNTSGLINYCQLQEIAVRAGYLKPAATMLFAAICSLFALPVVADEYHYNNILIGDRAAGMGGAYTAISDDPSGLYYNPSGIVYAQGTNVSASANAFHQSKTVYKDALGPGMDYERYSSALLPNFFGIVQPLGRGRVGFSYAVPDSIMEDQNQTFYSPNANTDQFAINLNNTDNTYNFGPSYAVELNEKFSIGATLYAHYRKNEYILNQLTVKTGNTYEWINQFYKHTEWGIKPILGMMWNPVNKLSVGISLSKVSILDSETISQSICSSDIPDNILTTQPDQGCAGVYDAYAPGNDPVRVRGISDIKRDYPMTTTIGVAYFPSKMLIVSGDISHYGKAGPDVESIWNIALGAEYYLNSNWALKGGIFTDKANTPKIKSSDTTALDHVDQVGGSLSITYFTRQSSITFGTTLRSGSGQAQIRGDGVIQDVESLAWTSFLSAAYFY